MGLFCLPPRPADECTPDDFVDTAIANLKLWKDVGGTVENDYLITFAITYLNDAMRKLRPLK